jgi:putative RecB family exonuclease
MAKYQEALQQFQEGFTLSYSQIFMYLSCGLKYKFNYVERRPQERISLALPFGRAIHKGIERYYRSFKDHGSIEPLSILEELFEESLMLDLDNPEVPVIFKKEAPDTDSALAMGRQLLKTFYEGIDIDGMEIVDVEVPLSAPLFTDTGEKTDFLLTGVIDLILRNTATGELVVVDNKTSKQSKSQSSVDDDNQMTSYSYLLATNNYIFPRAEVNCRFDVLRKLKTPKMEHYHTVRTAEHRKCFAKLANAVLKGIDNHVFVPTRSWMCIDCQYADACSKW